MIDWTPPKTPWPLRPLDRLVIWSVKRIERHNRCLVEDGPEAERTLFWLDLGRYFFTLACVIGIVLLPSPFSYIPWIGLGLCLAGTLSTNRRPARAYRDGWLEGRGRFIGEGGRHMEEGHPIRQWVETEIEHDRVNVFGVTPDIPNDGSGTGDGYS